MSAYSFFLRKRKATASTATATICHHRDDEHRAISARGRSCCLYLESADGLRLAARHIDCNGAVVVTGHPHRERVQTNGQIIEQKAATGAPSSSRMPLR